MKPTASVLALVASVSASLAGNGVSVTKIIHTDDPVPGMPGFTINLAPRGASLNDAGVLLFNGQIAGPGVTHGNNNVLMTRVGDSVGILAREGDPVPGLTGHIYLSGHIDAAGFYDLTVTPGSQIGYRAGVYNTVNSSGIWSAKLTGTPRAPQVAVYEGGPAPGFAGHEFRFLQDRASVIDPGLAAVIGRALGDSSPYAVWTGNWAGMVPALQTGLQAPGLPIGVNIQSFGNDSLRMNAMGRIAFMSTLATGPGGVNTTNRFVLYEGPPDQLGVLARSGSAVPGLPGAVFTFFDTDSIRTNASGALCFKANVSGGGTDQVLISHGAGQSFVLAKNGDPVPGHPGLTLGRLVSNRHDMNGLGRVAFAAQLVGAPFERDTAMFVGGPGGIEMVFREGDPLPGGQTIGNLENQPFMFNDREQFVLFTGGIWVTRPNGDWVSIARPSTGFWSDEGFVGVSHSHVPWRYESQALASGSGTSTIFNNEGQLLLAMVFTGSTGSGLYLIDVDDPCPADLVLPFGLLDLNDVSAFVSAFVGGDPIADLDGSGLVDLTDVNTFVASFLAGCP